MYMLELTAMQRFIETYNIDICFSDQYLSNKLQSRLGAEKAYKELHFPNL
jgi:hypothetical protein